MKNQIIKTSGMMSHLLITDDQLCFGVDTIKTPEAMMKELQREGKMKGAKSIDFSNINSLEFNEEDNYVKVAYYANGGKTKSKKFIFNSKAAANNFGNLIGGDLAMQRQIRNEKKWLKLLGNLALFVFAVGFLVYIFNENNFNSFLDSEHSSSRSGRKVGLIQVVLAMLGHKGAIAVTALITAVTGYSGYTEFKKPAQVVTFSR